MSYIWPCKFKVIVGSFSALVSKWVVNSCSTYMEYLALWFFGVRQCTYWVSRNICAKLTSTTYCSRHAVRAGSWISCFPIVLFSPDPSKIFPLISKFCLNPSEPWLVSSLYGGFVTACRTLRFYVVHSLDIHKFPFYSHFESAHTLG